MSINLILIGLYCFLFFIQSLGVDGNRKQKTRNFIYKFSIINLGHELDEQVEFKQHKISTTQALAMSDWLLDIDARVIDAIKYAKERGFCSAGDAVIVITGWVN
jgi:hypothetical protein